MIGALGAWVVMANLRKPQTYKLKPSRGLLPRSRGFPASAVGGRQTLLSSTPRLESLGYDDGARSRSRVSVSLRRVWVRRGVRPLTLALSPRRGEGKKGTSAYGRS